MSTINLDQEWDFVITKTHSEKPSRANLAKREMLFALQILLSKIGAATEAGGGYSLNKNYSILKAIYCSEKVSHQILHETPKSRH